MIPKLKTGVRLGHDPARGRDVVFAPERVLVPDETALAVLRLCDGVKSLDDIAAALAAEYDAPPEVISADVEKMLTQLARGGIVEL